jgi:CheY-like chemotaxis protein
MGLETPSKAGRILSFELPAGRPNAAAGRIRVLIVDDNQAHREILHRYFDHWGVRSFSAPDGPSALASLRGAAKEGDPFDVAVLDLAMPGMDGFALGEAIGDDPGLAGTRLILLTAFDEQGQGREALRQGFSAYLCKPVRHSQLLATVRRLLGDDRTETSPEAPA